MTPRQLRNYANRRRYVKFDHWPGDIHNIPLHDAYYIVGPDGDSLTPTSPFGREERENCERQNRKRLSDDRL